MAYSSRDAKYVMNVHGRWDSAAEDEKGIAWAREFFAKSQPLPVPARTSTSSRRRRATASLFAYGGTYKRLVDVKKKYDPTNSLPDEPEHQAAVGAKARRWPGGAAAVTRLASRNTVAGLPGEGRCDLTGEGTSRRGLTHLVGVGRPRYAGPILYVRGRALAVRGSS